MPICIAGMHRSGTSMLAQMLQLCGLNLGSPDELVPATSDNPDGHWEHKEFHRLNEQLLNQFGGGWDQPPTFSADWQHDERLYALCSDAQELIASFPTEQIWGWKDPRNSLTLPFWKNLLPNLKVIVCVRNPLDVASSLHHRGLSSYRFGLALWQAYNERLLADAPPDRRIVVHYNSLFADLHGELRRLIEFLELPVDEEQFNLACATVKPNLRHHRLSIDDLVQAGVTPAIIDLYLRLCEETAWSEFQEDQCRHRAPHDAACSDEAELAGAIPSLVGAGVLDQVRREHRRFGTIGTEQPLPLSPLNLAVIEMTELKSRQQRPRPETRPAVPTPSELKEHLAKLREQLDAIQQQNRIRDDGLAQQARDLAELQAALMSSAAQEREQLRELIAELRTEWRQEVQQLQTANYDLSARQRLGQSIGTDASNQIRYQQTIHRLRAAVQEHLPRRASVLVVSRGDEELLKLYGRRTAHFPQLKGGAYAGYYPQCSLAAIAHLETLRAQGADYLIFPEPALWWLEKYADFRRHLERQYRRVMDDWETGAIFSLRERSAWLPLTQALAECRIRLGHEAVILNWNTGLALADVFSEATVFSPPETDAPTLPYLDQSIDLIAVPADNPAMIVEARRVATQAVLLIESGESSLGEWGGVSPPVVCGITEKTGGLTLPRSPDSAKLTTSDRDGEFEFTCRVEWMAEAATAQLPSVSIVIAVHNQAAITEACLTSLVETLPESFRGEIIVVDDASTDDSPALLDRWAARDPRVRWRRNDTNQGFLETARRGAAAATGDVLLFLNNDTVLLPDWLPPLLRVFRDFPLAGAVGGKLLFSDGVLQEAGGMVFCDASAANFGRGDHNLDAPPYNFLREVDYCSGAMLATRRSLFEQIGGFDPRFRPAYYEDTDYCFAVRQQDYRVYFQPESAIVHLEGVSSGTDLSRGIKQYQVVNQIKFAEKWATVLARQPRRPPEQDRSAWNALALGHAVTPGERS